MTDKVFDFVKPKPSINLYRDGNVAITRFILAKVVFAIKKKLKKMSKTPIK